MQVATDAVWGSDNTAVATVSATGLVTAVGAGEVTIFADVNPRGTLSFRVFPRLDGIWQGLEIRVYPGFPTPFWGLSGFCVGDSMGKSLWKLVENTQRFPRRGGRVRCVHGAVSFHRARPCATR